MSGARIKTPKNIRRLSANSGKFSVEAVFIVEVAPSGVLKTGDTIKHIQPILLCHRLWQQLPGNYQTEPSVLPLILKGL